MELQILQKLEKLESLFLRGFKEVYTTPEAALYLGVSERHIYRLTASRKIIVYKPEGKLCYFKKTDLDEYVLRNRIPTSAELQEQAIAYINAPKQRGGKK